MSSDTAHGRASRFGNGRFKFQGAHRATADVHEALQRGDVVGSGSMTRQVFVDERVAEFVRQRVGQQARQAVKCLLRQFGKTEALLALQLHA